MTDDFKCEVCGIEVTSGLMGAMCPLRERCEFWPDDKQSQDFLDSMGMRYVPKSPPTKSSQIEGVDIDIVHRNPRWA